MSSTHGRMIACLALALAGVAGHGSVQAANPLQPAIDALGAHRYEMAARIYQELSTKDGVDDTYRYLAKLGVAAAHARLFLYEQAINEYLEAEAGNYHWSWAGSAVAYEAARAGDLQEMMIPVFEEICSKEDYKDPYTYLIQLYRDVGNIAKANEISKKKNWDLVPVSGDLYLSVREADRFTNDDATRLRLLVNNLKDVEAVFENRKYHLSDAAGTRVFEGDVPPTKIGPKGLVEINLPITMKGTEGPLTLTTDIAPAFREVICVASSTGRRKAASIKAAGFEKLTLLPEDAAVLFGGEFRTHTYVPTGGKFSTNRAYCPLSKNSYAEFLVNSDARVRATAFLEWANNYGHSMFMRLIVNDNWTVDDRRKLHHDGADEGLSDFWLEKGTNSIKVLLAYPNTNGTFMLRNLVSLALTPRIDDLVTGTVDITGDDAFFYAGTEKTFAFTLENYLDHDVTCDATLEMRLEVEGREPFFTLHRQVSIEANKNATVEVPVEVDGTGTLLASLYLRTGRGIVEFSKRFCSLFRVPDEFNYDSPYIITWQVGDENEALWAERAAKVGIRWSSDEIWWARIEPKQGEYGWDFYDKRVELARKYKTYLIPIFGGCPEWANLWHGNTPKDVYGTTARWKVDPQNMQWYEDYVTKFTNRYGDVVKAVRLFNESFEGGGPSGWRYRGDLHQAYGLSVKKAIRQSNYKNVLLVGPDGHNLFHDTITWNKDACGAFDIGSYHPYTGATQPMEVEAGPYFASLGKQCWNTESWDRIYQSVKTVCMESAIGVQKTSPFCTFHLGSQSWLDGFCKANTLIHFSFYSTFYKEINPHCMPWMFAYKAKDPRGCNFAVIFGRLFVSKDYVWDQIDGDGSLTLADAKLQYTVYDFYGNQIDTGTKKKVIPLNTNEYYVQTSGEIDELVHALETAEIDKLRPVQIGVYDIAGPLDRSSDGRADSGDQRRSRLSPPLRTVLKVELQNAYNVPLSGKISVRTPTDLRLRSASLKFKDLVPGKRTVFEFPIAGGVLNPGNRYPLKITVDTSQGRAELDEAVSLALIKRGTPTIDGDPSEWSKLGAVPVHVLAEGNYLPVKDAMKLLEWKADKGDAPELLNGKGVARFCTMYDDQYFYLLAHVLDGREQKDHRNHARVSMLGQWFRMMDPPADMIYAAGPSVPGGMLQIAFDCIPAEKQQQYYPPDSPYYRRVSFFDTDYEFSIYPTTDGKPEVWCNMAPGIRYDDFYPFTPKGEIHQDVVADARAAITHDPEMRVWVYEAAIPLSRIKDLQPQPGKAVRFNFLIRCIGHWSEGRSTCVINRCTFHPTSGGSFSDDVEWGFAD